MRVETPDIYLDLQQKLVDAAFTAGEKIKPAELQGVYGCSANTIREILLRLSNIGLVTFEAQRGFRVAEANQNTCNDITRFRIMLEQEGAAASMRLGGLQWESDLAASHHKLVHIEREIAREGELQAYITLWSNAERDFHQTLISACGSDVLRETYQRIYLRFRQQMVSLERQFVRSYFETVTNEHGRILEAALSRDEAACRLAIYDHLKRNIREVRE
ncbi:MAG: GntR family transcriptional regulator [Silicimonas sp.]|nr:GntR family transcriptional regulator [Silicimonas sp.]NNF92282.1 GntR family transcriptional regulator [Boseongicola sp.]RZW07013.1 MAG: GntR family transcriptional regulator [Paracoccaceae bacterium]NND17854.1 GntR family transcriptional regulator [Silicimonas sp.]NND20913.1 GntR family transcriptional regulator [Silicimonas sp.]